MIIDADRSLLFGLLAIQLDFIHRDQLIDSMNSWAISKDRTIADLLEASGAITSECRKLLDSLVDEHVRKHGGNAHASLATMPVSQLLQSQLSRIADPQIDESLRTIGKVQESVDPFATVSFSQLKNSSRRFRVLRAHAEGGLGTVSVARDEELNREVALKEIQTRYADDESARARFVLEAEVTGGLEHPNIVPVYGLGYYEDGRPYYAMRFIKGDSLKEVVDRFHSSDLNKLAEPSSRMVELRNLLGRFVDVCQAVDYAHSRGVIHRDLKPGNIMLGAYGETLLVDWGLAKAGGTSSLPVKLGSECALTPTANQSLEPTQMGATVGTLQFMSPEQAAGRTDLLGPATDIYSLGATLYYILTGKTSITGNNMAELLRAVQTGNFQLPSLVRRDIPKALEAICVKAMSLEPTDRYSSAQAMARDLESWMADEPVSSFRESTSEQIARWLRRHRTWFRAVSTAVLSIIFVLVIAVVMINEQRNVAEQQRELADGLAREKTALADRETVLRKKAEWQSASRSIEQSISICRHTDVATGILSLVRDLEEVQRIKAGDLESAVRTQLGRWEGSLHTLQSVVAYPDSIRTLAQSPDGDLMLVGTNGLSSLVEVASGRTIGKPLNHTEPVSDALFRRENEVLITGSVDKSVRFWSTRTGESIGTPLLHEEPVAAIALTLDEKYLATASGSKIRLWDVETHEPTGIEFDQKAELNDLVFSPSEPVILAGDWNGRVKLWNIKTKEQVGADWEIGYPVMTIAVSSDGRLAATGDISNAARLWFIATGESAGAPLAHFGVVTHADFSLDGTQLLTSSADQMVRLWDVVSKSMIGSPLRHPSVVNSAVFDRGGKSVWTGCSDKGLRQWQLANGKSVSLELGQNGNVIEADFNNAGTALRMLVGGIGGAQIVFPGELRRWNVPSGTRLGTPTSNKRLLGVAAFTHSGDFVAAVTTEGTVQIFSVADGEPSGPAIQATGEVKVLSFSHDDSLLLVGNNQGQVQLWRVASGEPARSLIELDARISSSAFFPDDQRFIVGSWDETARIYSVSDESNFTPKSLKHDRLVTSVGVHPDGSNFFTCLGDGSLRFWDSQTCQQIGNAVEIMPRPKLVTFSQDGKSILTGCLDGSTRQWDTQERTEIGPPLRQSKEINALAQSPNGRWIATASNDWTARLWDIGPEVGSYDQIKSKYELHTCAALESDGKLKTLSIEDCQSRLHGRQITEKNNR